MTSTYIDYRAFSRTYAERAEKLVTQGPSAREIEYFAKNIGNVSTGEELLADQKLYRFAMTAFDLESQIYAKGIVRKLLREGVEDPLALANRLTDQKFKTFAKAFAFKEVGDFNTKNPEFVAAVIERYTQVKMELNAGEQNIAVRLGAYFDRAAPRVSNWYAVLADKALREVVFTAFDFPEAIQASNPDRLVARLEDRFDIEDLKDPEKRADLIKRFTLMYDIRNGSPALESARTQLFAPLGNNSGGGQIISIDPGTLQAIRTS